MSLQTLEQFLESDLRNAWIKFECIQIYVRKSQRINLHKHNRKTPAVPVFDIANMSASITGTGAFTKFLHHLENLLKSTKFQTIFIENLMNDRLCAFLKRDFNFIEANSINTEALLPCLYKSIGD